jgi:hypothetical protein
VREDPVFTDAAIRFLRECVFDPDAFVGYELLSGAVHWSDERFSDFYRVCRAGGADYAKELFAYRTSLLVGRPREEYQFVWDEVRARCPEWIGFRPERITAASRWQEFVDTELDAY